MEAMTGMEVGMGLFPTLHFTVQNGQLEPTYSQSAGSLMYDSPPVPRRSPPKYSKQRSLDETNRKKTPGIHSPPMRKKALSSSPPIHEEEDLGDDFVHLELDENENRTEGSRTGETNGAEAGADSSKKQKRHRKVSFADSAGKELAEVRVFEEPEPEVRVREPEPELEPLQLLSTLVAADSDDFRQRFEKNHLIVEKLSMGTVNIAGRIRVRGLPVGSEERRVSVRSTTSAWMSYTKQLARYIQPVPKFEPDSKKNDKSPKRKLSKEEKKRKSSKEEVQEVPHDSYCFEIGVDRHAQALQFYITSCDHQGKPEFEDNNEGEMYTVLNPNYIEPIQEAADEEEEDEEEGWASWMGRSEWDNDYY